MAGNNKCVTIMKAEIRKKSKNKWRGQKFFNETLGNYQTLYDWCSVKIWWKNLNKYKNYSEKCMKKKSLPFQRKIEKLQILGKV